MSNMAAGLSHDQTADVAQLQAEMAQILAHLDAEESEWQSWLRSSDQTGHALVSNARSSASEHLAVIL